MLYGPKRTCSPPRKKERLNAPFGALFFMTVISEPDPTQPSPCLNAPFGARRFLTDDQKLPQLQAPQVIMRLMALGAF